MTLEPDNISKLGRIEARATHQQAVHVPLLQDGGGVVGLDRAAVEQPGLGSNVRTEQFLQLGPDGGAHLLGVTSLLLTLLILLHKGRGGGLSDMFGGGMSSGLSSSGVAEKNLNRFTVILGITWGAVIIALGLLMRFTGVADS